MLLCHINIYMLCDLQIGKQSYMCVCGSFRDGALLKKSCVLRRNIMIILPAEGKYQILQGLLISSWPDLLPDLFCVMVRIYRLMLVLFYIYIVLIFLQL